MKGLSISGKLWLAVGLMVLGLAAVVTFAAWRNKSQQAEAAERTAVLDQRLHIAQEWQQLTNTNVVRNMALMLSNEPALERVFKAEATQVIETINGLQKRIEAMPLNADEQAALKDAAQHRARVLEVRKKIIALRADGQAEQAAALMDAEFLPARDLYIKGLNRFVALQQQALTELRDELAARSRATVVYASTAVVVLLVLIVLGAAWLIRSIRQPLHQSVRVAEAIAAGDLTQVIVTDRTDEFGQLLQSLAHMNQSLGQLVRQVLDASGNIQQASAEVAMGTQDLATRTEQVGANLERTASSMGELTSTVQQSADAARQANQLASNSAEVAARGGQVVREVVTTMADINRSSQKIADIIGVIDGIAFQTNILALNAAVEAARAGEQGRGFAVVAGEVRSLAQRSAQAAKEIKDLITDSVQRVHSGSEQVETAGRTVDEIVASVQRVTDVIGEITAATTEQTAEIVEVNAAVSQVDQMTQQNAALVEESTAAAHSLQEQAHRLIEVVSRFKVEGHALPGRSAPAPRVTPPPVSAPGLTATRSVAPAPKNRLDPPRVARSSTSPTPVSRTTLAAPKPQAAEGDWETF